MYTRQAQWSLFFNCFNFPLTFKPGSKNVKPDTLSCQFLPPDVLEIEKNIVPPARVVGTLTWNIEGRSVRLKKLNLTWAKDPLGLYVPSIIRSKVLTWLHSSKLSFHTGSSHMLSLAKRHIWWPSINQDIREFMAACPICTRNKPDHQPIAGLL